jgi:hypothetical protein
MDASPWRLLEEARCRDVALLRRLAQLRRSASGELAIYDRMVLGPVGGTVTERRLFAVPRPELRAPQVAAAYERQPSGSLLALFFEPDFPASAELAAMHFERLLRGDGAMLDAVREAVSGILGGMIHREELLAEPGSYGRLRWIDVRWSLEA